MNHSQEHGSSRPPGPNWSRINQWLLWIGLAAAIGWMFYRHNAHLGQLLPFLILLACPLLHLFGHGGHGGHRGHSRDVAKPDTQSGSREPPSAARGGHQH